MTATTTTASTALERRTAGDVSLGAGEVTLSDYRQIETLATQLAQSRIIPKPYWGKPADIIAAALVGRDLGLSTMASLRMLHVIDGKVGQSAELMMATIRARGHRIEVLVMSDDEVRMRGTRADTGDTMEFSFTQQHAQDAGLAHKANWKGYFRSMAAARVTTQLGRTLFADVILGVSYSPEELAEIGGVDVKVDTSGEVQQVVEISDVEVVRDTPTTTADASSEEPAPPADIVSTDAYDAILHRASMLDDPEKEDLKGWSRAIGISWDASVMTQLVADSIAVKLDELEGTEEVAAEDVSVSDDPETEAEPERTTPDGVVIPPNPARSRRRSPTTTTAAV